MKEQEAKKVLLNKIKKGDEVYVTRGPQKGLRGTVKRVWDAGKETKVEIDENPEESPNETILLETVSRKHVSRIWPGLEPNQDPKGGWCALLQRQENRHLVPAIGDLILHRDTDEEGYVVLIEDGVLGCNFPDYPRTGFSWVEYTKALVNIREPHLTRLRPHPLPRDARVTDEWVPYAKDVKAEPNPEDNLMSKIHQVKSGPNKNQWEAYDKEGTFLLHLPAETASHFISEMNRKNISWPPG
jgi:preprotein translocase subunit YajC